MERKRRGARPGHPMLLHARSLWTNPLGAGFLAPGSSPRLLGLPRFPEWRRFVRAYLLEAGSPATVAGPRRFSTCFPFTLPKREAP